MTTGTGIEDTLFTNYTKIGTDYKDRHNLSTDPFDPMQQDRIFLKMPRDERACIPNDGSCIQECTHVSLWQLIEGSIVYACIHPAFHGREQCQLQCAYYTQKRPAAVPSSSNALVKVLLNIHPRTLPTLIVKTACAPGGVFYVRITIDDDCRHEGWCGAGYCSLSLQGGRFYQIEQIWTGHSIRDHTN
ncbi:uncharacterized protein BT62DRAFT_1080947 [Guyanagaster necrorhizus]|uniref:Uncharacterized protein n=1 Tax=Guyanagaster necrorhizus TaxID=856835 RepID=A0A9P8AM56_9AGAR|nr:uncharacterized protein BT62DRAFT_1080947 [Guyanagaster necrorhizus MCA 3950]KAG7440331.1 hypothetical protein BT62DRAFT_1080947 [Guyanagaster necrorhizus MCA 3950]